MTPKNRHLHSTAQLCRAISSQLRHVLTIGKTLVKQQYLLHLPHNMVNFGPVAAEVGSGVWGIPANFNRFRALAALLHGTLVVGVSKLRGIEQRAPPIFGRAAIMLGIGPHSSFVLFLLFFPRLISAVADWMSTILRHMVWPLCEFRMQV